MVLKKTSAQAAKELANKIIDFAQNGRSFNIQVVPFGGTMAELIIDGDERYIMSLDYKKHKILGFEDKTDYIDTIIRQLKDAYKQDCDVTGISVYDERGFKSPIVLAQLIDATDGYEWLLAGCIDENGVVSELSDCGLFDSLHGTHTDEQAIEIFD